MRMIKYRGNFTGTMVYDQKGIMDHFAKIDENTMLGVMEMKGAKNPYFYVLERDSKKQDHSRLVSFLNTALYCLRLFIFVALKRKK